MTSDSVDVVVPIHDAYDALERCLASVAAHTCSPHRLVLIDDASRDPRVAALLDRVHVSSPDVVVMRHRENRGFVRTANEGLAASGTSDVVLLNSDTVVTAGWLDKLRRAARSRKDVATVTPLTNNGTLCTVPDVARPGEIPAGWTADDMGALVESLSFHLRPEAPTGVGFCLYVTRDAIRRLGGFDAEVFGDGYGEENDFCRRAIAAGMVNLIADDTFVYHQGGASFGPSKGARVEANLARLRARHPGYDGAIERYYRDHPLAGFHRVLARHVRDGGPGAAPRVRVLHVLHEGGGTEKHARDLAAEAGEGFVSFVARSDGASFDVEEYRAGAVTARLRMPFAAALPREFTFAHGAYREAVDALCALTGADVVHVHHLLAGTLDVAEVAGHRGVPYCVTLHDYFALCPRYTLLDPDGRVCDGCTVDPRGPRAARCMDDLGATTADLEEHQRRLRAFLDRAARLFVPSASAAAMVLRRHPDLDGRLRVIEHGIAGPRRPPVDVGNAPRTAENPLRVAIIGGLNHHKGQDALLDLLDRNTGDALAFHFFGAAEGDELSSLPVGRETRLRGSRITYHGRYASGTIVPLLADARIDVGLQLSTWPETFSYTLSEYAMAGIPVVALDRGAVGARVARDRLGWLADDVPKVLEVLETLAREPAVIGARAGARSRGRSGAARAARVDALAALSHRRPGLRRAREDPAAMAGDRPRGRPAARRGASLARRRRSRPGRAPPAGARPPGPAPSPAGSGRRAAPSS